MKPIVVDPQSLARFNALVDMSGECWLWQGAPNGEGYGRIMIDSVRYQAHRVAYTIARGPIPTGLLVCHTCDVRLCVNPDHLFIGTDEDNMRDRDSKLRQSKGSHRPHAKITEQQAVAIRADPRTHRSIANAYGLATCTVTQIKNRNAWRHA
jgi:HNH endonuclease